MTDSQDAKQDLNPDSLTEPDTPIVGEAVAEEERIEEEGGARRRVRFHDGKRRLPRLPSVRIHPFRTILILAVIIFILLMLILKFGLGGGGGKILPGSGETTGSVLPDKAIPIEPETTELEKPAMRRELNISFFPSASDPAFAQEMTCTLDWIDATTESQESRRIASENMTDFEFELEKAIRNWRLSLGSGETQDVPIVAVTMTPFPGEGVFRKIETIAHRIDPRISILRLESSNVEM